MVRFDTIFRVAYADTDQMGVMYHGAYARYLEVARVDCLRSLGIQYKEVEKMGIFLPVLEMNIKFLQPIFYDDLVRIEVSINTLPRRSFCFDYQLFKDDVLVSTAKVILVCVSKETKKSMVAPDFLLEALNPYFE
ncbi:MAG: acyl-CoA thioesterase [Bacteroidia bacterium]|jgi:acyl-CoA thioester hydrolase